MGCGGPRERPVLLADYPRAHKAEALAQPEHGLEALMVRRALGRDWEPPIRGMFFLTRKWSLPILCCRCLVT